MTDSVLGPNVSVVTENRECPTVFAQKEDAIAEYRRLVGRHRGCFADMDETPEERAFAPVPPGTPTASDKHFWCECDTEIGLFHTTLVRIDRPDEGGAPDRQRAT